MIINRIRRLRMSERHLIYMLSKEKLFPIILMKFLSEKQVENPDDFEEVYGFKFRDYELFSNIQLKIEKKDSSYKSDIKSALFALKNSQNEYIRLIYESVPEKVAELKDLPELMELLNEVPDYQKLFFDTLNSFEQAYIHPGQSELNRLLSRLAQIKHIPKKVFSPICNEATTITSLDTFENAWMFEENESLRLLALQNLILNEIPFDKFSLSNKAIYDDMKYDTIVPAAMPIYTRRREEYIPSEFKRYGEKNFYKLLLYYLIDHLDEGGKLVICVPKEILVKRDSMDLRKKLIDENLLDTVIEHYPFFRSNISLSILIIDKNKETEDFFFIKENDTRLFRSGLLTEKVLECYEYRENVPKFSQLIDKETIIKNKYNLNPNRYVYSLDYERVDMDDVITKQKEYTSQIRELDGEIEELLDKIKNK